jgi:hypothetical protein
MPILFGWALGWQDKRSMLHTAAASGCLLASSMALRAAGASPAWLQPFGPGLAVLGSVCFYLAGLIMSNRWYSWCADDGGGTGSPGAQQRRRAYLVANGLYLLLLLGGAGAGMVLQMGGLSNTAATFLALWLGEKVAELAWGGYQWVVLFGASLALWRASLFLAERPEWLAGMLRL